MKTVPAFFRNKGGVLVSHASTCPASYRGATRYCVYDKEDLSSFRSVVVQRPADAGCNILRRSAKPEIRGWDRLARWHRKPRRCATVRRDRDESRLRIVP